MKQTIGNGHGVGPLGMVGLMSQRTPVVLIAEDEPEIACLLEVLVGREGFKAVVVSTADDAISKARSVLPDLLLLDLGLPGGHGTTVCDALRGDLATAHIPIVIVTADHAKETLVEGFDRGATDYITKPFDPVELVARVRAAIRMKLKFDEISERAAALEEVAFVDALTGLYNRRRMLERLDEEYKRAKRYAYPIGCLFIDIDLFKEINDHFSHQAGDTALCEIANLIRGCIRAYDVPCRYGGDEIVVLLPQADTNQSTIVAERIRGTVESMTQYMSKHPLTVSIGVAAIPDSAMDAMALLANADAAMYNAKMAGRNRVCLASAVVSSQTV